MRLNNLLPPLAIAAAVNLVVNGAVAEPAPERSNAAARPAARLELPEQRATPPAANARALTADEQRYAAREASSPNAQEYRGGDAIVIGASTATVVLAVILLIVLL